MPRNSSGTYSLYTPGNPVVTSTVISSTWANNTLADLASALTDSLSRTGDGGMQAPLELDDGAVGAPGLTWATESTSGWYRASAGVFRFSVSSTDRLAVSSTGLSVTGSIITSTATGGSQGAGTINATAVYDDGVLLANQTGANPTGTIGLTAVNGSAGTFMRSDGAPALSQAIVPTWTANHTWSSALPRMFFNNTSAGTDAKAWEFRVGTTGTFSLIADTDAFAGSLTALSITRSAASNLGTMTLGVAGDTMTYNFAASGATTWAGSGAFSGDLTFTVSAVSYSAGYRGLPSRSISTSDSTAALDNGRTVLFTGAGSQTFTVDSDFGTAGNVMVLLNGGTGALSVAETLSGTMTWLNGSGTLSTGTRTLAIGGVATIWMADSTNAYIWGTGLS